MASLTPQPSGDVSSVVQAESPEPLCGRCTVEARQDRWRERRLSLSMHAYRGTIEEKSPLNLCLEPQTHQPPLYAGLLLSMVGLSGGSQQWSGNGVAAATGGCERVAYFFSYI